MRIELYDGEHMLESACIDTPDVRLTAQKDELLCAEWNEPIWHEFHIDVSNLPRSLRVVVTVIGMKKVVGSKDAQSASPEEKILTTGVNAFAVDGLLVQGTQDVSMLNNLYDCKQGPIPHIVDPSGPLIQVCVLSFVSL